MVRALDIIETKKQGGVHSPADLTAFVSAYCAGEVPDYQMAAWLMAVRWQGLADVETKALTAAMAASGEQLDLAAAGLPGPFVDKHSTGGVGDKLSIIVVPLLIAAGVTIVKLSGAGLGHTGGTVDKLEAIPGLRTKLSTAEMIEVARAAGGCMAAHTKSLVPADGLIYALRDATATVDSLPLIASSIMAKKIASGAKSLVLDVKVGRGAFMRSESEAAELARLMVDIAASAGLRATAVLTAMDQPLGSAVGNALEVNEAVDVLAGGGPPEVRELSVTLAAHGLVTAGVQPDLAAASRAAERLLGNGDALMRLAGLVKEQGGDPRAVDGARKAGSRLPAAAHEAVLQASHSGEIAAVDAYLTGRAAVLLGAGRSRKEEPVDPGAGILLQCRAGDRVDAGQPLARLFASDPARLVPGLETLRSAITWAVAAEDDARPGQAARAGVLKPGQLLGVIGPG